MIFLAAGAAMGIAAAVLYNKFGDGRYVHKATVFFAGVAAAASGNIFYLRWLPSSQAAALAGRFSVPAKWFIFEAAAVLGILAVHAVDMAFYGISRLAAKAVSGRILRWISGIVTVFIAEYLVMEFSSISFPETFLNQGIRIFLLNIAIVGALNLILLLIVQKWKITLVISSLFFGVWGTFNYYVILYHGSPFYVSELANVKTAAAVMGQYNYPVVPEFVFTVIFTFLAVCVAAGTPEPELTALSRGKRWILRLCIALGGGAAALVISLNVCSSKQAWSPWDSNIEKFGFMVSVLDDIQGKTTSAIKPEGYSEEMLDEIIRLINSTERDDGKGSGTESEYPDIILILNETFCDIGSYTDIHADTDYMTDFYDIDGALYGYTVTPSIGGGTNNSEFELLMSKSMYILPTSAPFTYLDNSLLGRSIASYLNKFGYETRGLHCEIARNYSRDTAYPAMGFKEAYLGPDVFSYFGTNGNRAWLDEDNYHDLEDITSSAGETPQFSFVLTFQNHGGYEQNDAGLDTVHVKDDFGDLTDDVEEFLSSIKLSCEAFRDLTEYYRDSERKVVICMVGDHAPSFISSLAARKDPLIADDSICKRLVPYVIWTNFETDADFYTDYASMVDLVPMALRTAGVPLSAYYQEILELHELYPVRTSDGLYVDREGTVSVYDLNDSKCRKIRDYYYLEYNSLQGGETYREAVFEP